MLPLRYQGLALPNPNIARLSKKIHLLQVLHWDTGSMIERMLHQAYQVFQVEVGLHNHLRSLVDLLPMDFSAIFGSCYIVTAQYSAFMPTLTFHSSGHTIAHLWMQSTTLVSLQGVRKR